MKSTDAILINLFMLNNSVRTFPKAENLLLLSLLEDLEQRGRIELIEETGTHLTYRLRPDI